MIQSYDGTILLIDDDDAVRRVVARSLRAAGYFVYEHASGESALTFLRGHAGPIDLLITDTVLSGMNGVQTAHALRGLRPGLPVLRMSGYAGFSAEDSMLDASWHFVAKPFRGDQLASIVRAIVGAPAASDREPAA